MKKRLQVIRYSEYLAALKFWGAQIEEIIEIGGAVFSLNSQSPQEIKRLQQRQHACETLKELTMNSQSSSAGNAGQLPVDQANALAQSMGSLSTTGFTTLSISLRPMDPDSIKYKGSRTGDPGFSYVSSLPLLPPVYCHSSYDEVVSMQTALPFILVYVTNSHLLQPKTRTMARWIYGEYDLRRLVGLPTPENPGPNSNIDVTNIRRPNIQRYHGRSPRVFLEELKYDMIARQVQEMEAL